MQLFLNNELIEMPEDISVNNLLQNYFLPQAGIAVAVNNQVVNKPDWDDTLLRNGDRVTVIQAACGG